MTIPSTSSMFMLGSTRAIINLLTALQQGQETLLTKMATLSQSVTDLTAAATKLASDQTSAFQNVITILNALAANATNTGDTDAATAIENVVTQLTAADAATQAFAQQAATIQSGVTPPTSTPSS